MEVFAQCKPAGLVWQAGGRHQLRDISKDPGADPDRGQGEGHCGEPPPSLLVIVVGGERDQQKCRREKQAQETEHLRRPPRLREAEPSRFADHLAVE